VLRVYRAAIAADPRRCPAGPPRAAGDGAEPGRAGARTDAHPPGRSSSWRCCCWPSSPGSAWSGPDGWTGCTAARTPPAPASQTRWTAVRPPHCGWPTRSPPLRGREARSPPRPRPCGRRREAPPRARGTRRSPRLPRRVPGGPARGGAGLDRCEVAENTLTRRLAGVDRDPLPAGSRPSSRTSSSPS
jgi:hypothetical protein